MIGHIDLHYALWKDIYTPKEEFYADFRKSGHVVGYGYAAVDIRDMGPWICGDRHQGYASMDMRPLMPWT